MLKDNTEHQEITEERVREIIGEMLEEERRSRPEPVGQIVADTDSRKRSTH